MSHPGTEKFNESKQEAEPPIMQINILSHPCAYPGCTAEAQTTWPCCDSRHGLALKQLKDGIASGRVFEANWRQGINAVNVLGDRYEEVISLAMLTN